MFKKRKAQRSDASTHREHIEQHRTPVVTSKQTKTLSVAARAEKQGTELNVDEQWEDEQLRRNGMAVPKKIGSNKLANVRQRLEEEIKRLEALQN